MNDKILVTRSSMPPFEEYVEEIRSIWDSRWLTNAGPKLQEFEKNLCDYLDTDNVTVSVNGHMALENIFEVLGLEGEVITTPFTFVSTTNSIVRSGLTPVFCDIKEDDFTLDPEKVEALITDKTCAIMPVHVYGNVCDDKALSEIAKKHGLKLIYDAAHAFGVKKDGVGVGNLGDASMFSFHATKVFHSIEGGAVVYKATDDAAKMRQCKNFGITGPESLTFCGGNSKMNEFSAAMGLCNLRHIDDAVESRKRAVCRYRERLSGVKGLQLSVVQENVQSNYAYFPLVVHPEEFGCTRDDVMEHLAQHNIGVRKYFYPLTSEVEEFGGKYPAENTPVAKRISDRVLCLPLYEGLDEETVDRICDNILNCGRK